MEIKLIQDRVTSFQKELFEAIKSATYRGSVYDNGLKAKEALIRSQTLINKIHEPVKQSLFNYLKDNTSFIWTVYPNLGSTSPEMKLYGKLKGKDQDLVFFKDQLIETIISDPGGPTDGKIDVAGFKATEKSIAVNIRSQMSSIDKNFDTLMERAFAETLNLRIKHPKLCMGEVYLIPIFELDESAMLENKVSFKSAQTKLGKFIKTFNAITSRNDYSIENAYKYDSTALLMIDLRVTPPVLVKDQDDLKNYIEDEEIINAFENIMPKSFDKRIFKAYKSIHL